MALDLSATFVVGISATDLFDMTESDGLFRSRYAVDPAAAVADYRAYMLAREAEPLADGTGMPLVRALLGLNRVQPASDPRPLVEVVVMSRNSPETGVRVFNNIRARGLPIRRHAFTGGESVVDYLAAFAVDLFLTTNVEDAQRVIDEQVCAAAIVKPPPSQRLAPSEDQVRIAFDGDAVLFDATSELVFRTQGLERFHASEDARQDEPLGDGPYAKMLRKLSRLQQRLAQYGQAALLRIALVTARGAPAEMRVIKTLRHWGVAVDEIFFLGGVAKPAILTAFKAHIYFDDQDLHLDRAAHCVPAGKVPYPTGSPLHPAPSATPPRQEAAP